MMAHSNVDGPFPSGKSLELADFFPASAKVRRAEFHPVKSWLLISTDTDVTVFDYESKREVLRLSPAALEAQRERESALQAQAERRSRFFGPKSAEEQPSKGGSSAGSVVRAFFVDADTAYWQTTRLRSILATSPTEVVVAPPGIPHTAAEALQGRRWIAIVSEHRVLLLDMRTRALRDLTPRGLEKPITDACALYFSGGNTPFLLGPLYASVLPSTTTRLGLWSRMREVRSNAIDGSARALFRDARTSFNAHAVAVSSLDGKAYVTTLDRGKAIGYCCHHPKSVPITCLAPAPGRDRAAADCLLAGCKDGSVLLFQPWDLLVNRQLSMDGSGAPGFRQMPQPGMQISSPVAQPIAATRLKTGTVIQVLPGPLPSAMTMPEPCQSCVYVLGDDRSALILTYPGLTVAQTAKPMHQGTPCIAACLVPILRRSSFLAVAKREAAVFSATASLGAVISGDRARRDRSVAAPILSLSHLAPNEKKAAKTYHIASHPTRAGLVAVSLNVGVAVLRVRQPLPQPSTAVLETRQASATSMALLTASSKAAVIQQFRLAQPSVHSLSQAQSATLERPLLMPGARAIIPLPWELPETPDTVANPQGTAVALVWRELRHWAVIASSPAPPGRAGSPASPSAGWRLLATGSGCCAAWDLRGQAVALSSMPPMAAVRTEQAKKKEAREQMETAERAREQAAWVTARLTVQHVRQDELVMHNSEVPIGQGRVAVRLFGGSLLGVVTAPMDDPWSRQHRLFHFHTWTQRNQPVAGPLPEPSWLSWSATDDLCAMGGHDGVHVLKAAPSGQGWSLTEVVVGSVPRSISGAWFGEGGLLVTTEDEAWALVVTGLSGKRRAMMSGQALAGARNASEGDRRESLQSVKSRRGCSMSTPWRSEGKPYVQSVCLASMAAHPLALHAHMPWASSLAPHSLLTALLTCQPLPSGGCKALGVLHDHAWLLDSNGWPHVVPLLLSGAKRACAPALGKTLDAAEEAAESALMSGVLLADIDIRTMVCAQLSAADPTTSGKLAAIPNLPAYMRLALSLETGRLGDAMKAMREVLDLAPEDGVSEEDKGDEPSPHEALEESLLGLLGPENGGRPREGATRAAAVLTDGTVNFKAFRGTARLSIPAILPPRSLVTSRAPSTRHHSRHPSHIAMAMSMGAPSRMSLQEDFLSAADRGDPGGRWPPADAVGATELCVAVVEALASVAGQGDGEGGSDGAEGAAVLEAARCVLERHEAFSENELMRVAAAVGSLGGGETGHDADATAFLADMAVELRGRWPRVGLVAGVMSGNLMVADAVLSQSGMRHLGAAVEELLRGKVTGSYGTLTRFDDAADTMQRPGGRIPSPNVVVDRPIVLDT